MACNCSISLWCRCTFLQALVAIKNLLQLRTIEIQVLKDFCGLDTALERLKQQLQDLSVEEYKRDYATDLEALRKEVELAFHRRLGMVGIILCWI